MSPEQLQKFEEMAQTIEKLSVLVNAIDAGFRNDAQIDPQYAQGIKNIVTGVTDELELNDLSDVDTSGVINGQVIKYNSGTWENDDDIDT